MLRKFINSFLYPRFLYQLFIREEHYQNLLEQKVTSNKWKKLIYFYPSIVDAKTWMEGGEGQYRDPKDFIELRKNIDKPFIEYFKDVVAKNSRILDLGCNSGRHLTALHSAGYTELNGVDVMAEALEKFRTTFADSYSACTLHHDFFQRFLLLCNDQKFDVTYTIGATIELVHPSFDIVREMCRVTRRDVLMVIQPDRHAYPRFYKKEFMRNSFKLKSEKRLTESHWLYHFRREEQI